VLTQWLMVIVIGLGLVCSIVFNVGLREVDTHVEQTFSVTAYRKSMEWYDWLKEHQFYLVIYRKRQSINVLIRVNLWILFTSSGHC